VLTLLHMEDSILIMNANSGSIHDFRDISSDNDIDMHEGKSTNHNSSALALTGISTQRRETLLDSSSLTKATEPHVRSTSLLPSTSSESIRPLNSIDRNIELHRNSSTTTAPIVLSWSLPATVRMYPYLTATSLEQCPTTVVAMYFAIPSKYPRSSYDEWIPNFLSLQDCMILFTSDEHVTTFQSVRQQLMQPQAHPNASTSKSMDTRTVIVSMNLTDLPIAQWHAEQGDFWPHQLAEDYERKRHKSYELFWIWLSKSWVVQQAITLNPFQSTYFYYSDMGRYRHAHYNGRTLVQHPEVVPPHTLAWTAHHTPHPPPTPYWNDKVHEPQYYFHSGSSALGDATAWTTFHTAFAHMLEAFVERNLFVGEDQCVLQATCHAHPHLCVYVVHAHVRDNRYAALRTVLHDGTDMHGKSVEWWRFPPMVTIETASSST
jgi:hypothetical protein